MAEIEKKRESRLICYLTSDREGAVAVIARDVLPLFFNQLRGLQKDLKRIDILLFTDGGDSLAAFALARMIREFVSWVGVLVPHKCHSAGTLFALGANEIFITRAGTLSPIDPSVQTPFNPWVEGPAGSRQQVPVSVESVAGFKDLVTDEWGIRNEALVIEAFKLLANAVPPLALGDVYRRREQIEQLARRLLKEHREDEARISELIAALTKKFGSHDYPISRSEARDLFGQKQIAPDNPELEDLVWRLFEDYTKELQLGTPYNPAVAFQQLRGQVDKDGKVHIKQNLAVIENTLTRDVYEQEILLSEIQAQGPPSLKRVQLRGLQQEVADAGWKNYKNPEA